MIVSTQTGVHEKLAETLERYRRAVYQRPISNHTQDAFDSLDWNSAPLVLDTGCGVGESTIHLSKQYPDDLVVGVDKSAVRLATHHAYMDTEQKDYYLLQADLIDLWLLLNQYQIYPKAQYLLYPNPWPKAKRFKNRWPAHPVFPFMLNLGGYIEVRSNWRVYLEEFQYALSFYTQCHAEVESYESEIYMTPFERKYAERAEPLYRLVVTLPQNVLGLN